MATNVTLHNGHVFVDGEDLTYDALNDMFDLGFGEIEDDALTELQNLDQGNIIVGTSAGVGTLNAKEAGRLLVGNGADLTTLNMSVAGTIPVGDGTNVTAKTMSKDATMDASGEVTVHNQLTMETQWHADDTHFPEKVTSNAEDIIIIEDSNDGWVKKKMALTTISAAYPRYWKHNLVVKNSSAAPHTVINIDVDEIVLTDTSDRRLMLTDLALTVTMTGTGANGLDAGVLAASTMYYFWIIHKPAEYDSEGALVSAAVTAGLGSLSATSPTLPSGYSYKRLVGEIYTNGSTHLIPSVRNDNLVSLGNAKTDGVVYTSLTTSYVQKTLPASVPNGCSRFMLMLASTASEDLLQQLSTDASNTNAVTAIANNSGIAGHFGYNANYAELAHSGAASVYAMALHGSYLSQACYITGYTLPR